MLNTIPRISASMLAKRLLTSFAMASLIFTPIVSASPVSASNPIASLSKVGSGQMDYLFWSVYKAEYYLETDIKHGTLTVEEKLSDNNIRALKIEYLRTIESEALIQATEEQWQQLGYPKNKIDQWVAPLKVIWPNVESGSTLTVKVTPEGASQFYFNNTLIGQVQDAQFGQAFLSIWLSENTSEPQLRQQLLGLRK